MVSNDTSYTRRMNVIILKIFCLAHIYIYYIEIFLTIQKISIEYSNKSFYLESFIIQYVTRQCAVLEEIWDQFFPEKETYFCLQKWKIENEKCIFTLNPTECTKNKAIFSIFSCVFIKNMDCLKRIILTRRKLLSKKIYKLSFITTQKWKYVSDLKETYRNK